MYEAIIIGAGYAGLTAAQILEKKYSKILILEGYNQPGGQILFYPAKKIIYNLSDFPNISGPNLIQKLLLNLSSTQISYNERVIKICKFQNEYIIYTANKSEYKTKLLILATGYGQLEKYTLATKYLNLHYQIQEDWSNLSIAVLGGGDSAFEQALFLSCANKVTLIHRRPKFKASQELIDKANFPLLTVAEIEKYFNIKNNKIYKITIENIDIYIDQVLCCYGFKLTNTLDMSVTNFIIGDAYQRMPFNELKSHIINVINVLY